MRIGYQGIEGSNSEAVALEYVKKYDLDNAELVPLVDSKRVVNALVNRDIDLGVMATFNILGGIVTETVEALDGVDVEKVDNFRIPIHHSMFVKPGTKREDITIVASHIQALKQTEQNVNKLFPNCDKMEVEDTAIAARYLAEGKFDSNVAVLCRINAGESFGLELLFENLEDDSNNYTEFEVYRMK